MPPTFEESTEVSDLKCCFGSEGKTFMFDMVNFPLVLVISGEVNGQNCTVELCSCEGHIYRMDTTYPSYCILTYWTNALNHDLKMSFLLQEEQV